MPWGEIKDFEDGGFYGFCTDFEQKKERIQCEIRNEMGNKEYEMDTYGEETEEYKEARMSWEERKNELDKQIELNSGFGN